VESTNGTGLSPETTDYIPAQNLLTCFYSTNERYAMNNLELLSADRMSRIQNIPCIAVQGGEDPICPVDTALDLSAVWQSMELRIPLKSGHSMYDVAIANELVRATDRMATRLLDTGHTNVL
jgi:proline iminopeptidase